MPTRTQQLYDDHGASVPGHYGKDYTEGCPTCYPPMADYPWDLHAAKARGWDYEAHFRALLAEDEDAIALTHPTNWLTEEEVEAHA